MALHHYITSVNIKKLSRLVGYYMQRWGSNWGCDETLIPRDETRRDTRLSSRERVEMRFFRLFLNPQ